MVTNHQYVTQDTALAAWLSIKGIGLVRIERNRFPSSFVFNDPDSEAPELATEFNIGAAEGNIQQFYRAYRYLVSEVKNSNGEL